ncbi:hypothetical protein [Ferruginibacter profundus]
MRSKIILILILIFLSGSAFAQAKKTPQTFEKNVDLPDMGCFGGTFMVHTNYSITLFPDSIFRLKYTSTRYSWNNINIRGKYFIVDNVIHFLKDSTISFSSVFEFDTMKLIGNKLIGSYKTGGSFELEESDPFYKFLETKKSSITAKGKKTLYLTAASPISPQLSNKPNSF